MQEQEDWKNEIEDFDDILTEDENKRNQMSLQQWSAAHQDSQQPKNMHDWYTSTNTTGSTNEQSMVSGWAIEQESKHKAEPQWNNQNWSDVTSTVHDSKSSPLACNWTTEEDSKPSPAANLKDSSSKKPNSWNNWGCWGTFNWNSCANASSSTCTVATPRLEDTMNTWTTVSKWGTDTTTRCPNKW